MLTVRHTFRVVGTCPVDGAEDAYTVEVRVRGTDPDALPLVEALTAAAAEILAVPIIQETFTLALARRFGAEVETQCLHGAVHTVCTATPPPRGGWPQGREKTEEEKAAHSAGMLRASRIVANLHGAQREAYRTFRRAKFSQEDAARRAREVSPT